MAIYDKISCPARMLAAVAVAILTFAVVAQAATVITASKMIIPYSLASGASSAAITPPVNRAVLVMGVQNSVGFRGVGFVTMLSVPGSFLEWAGIESTFGAAITQGFSGTPGTHIVFLDFAQVVDIEVNTANTFIVHNANTITQTGRVTLIW